MKAISYRKFDAYGHFRGEKTSARKYTVRGAMAHLEANGFRPSDHIFSRQARNKLKYIWDNGKGTYAYIL